MKDFAKRFASQLDKEFRKGFTCALALVLLGYYNKVDNYIAFPAVQMDWDDYFKEIDDATTNNRPCENV